MIQWDMLAFSQSPYASLFASLLLPSHLQVFFACFFSSHGVGARNIWQ